MATSRTFSGFVAGVRATQVARRGDPGEQRLPHPGRRQEGAQGPGHRAEFGVVERSARRRHVDVAVDEAGQDRVAPDVYLPCTGGEFGPLRTGPRPPDQTVLDEDGTVPHRLAASAVDEQSVVEQEGDGGGGSGGGFGGRSGGHGGRVLP
ncbi:hypothetical protein [Streptomyces sp. NBC_01361]|uniref:hypothetical protein n=1 Tax=Streptomyces sp. NBC_01361 TaxID=2903838 RepID=UPI002E2FC5D3|nr:hypothetical protein [Streptomyces sp. NBC_01361]